MVVQVDPAITRFRVGARVAYGGNGFALHAEYIVAPDLLVARVPDGIVNRQAGYATIVPMTLAVELVQQFKPSLGEEQHTLRLRSVSPLSLTVGPWVSRTAHKVSKLLRSAYRAGQSLET